MEGIARNQVSTVKPPLTQEQKKQKNATLQDLGRPNFLMDDIERFSKPAGAAGNATRVQVKSDAERNLDGIRYRLGDMVWAKVKSHPWWPGQLYDPNLASSSAMELKRDDCFLVAFFGDSTFGWFSESELIPFDPNFTSKSKQTTTPNFVDAVEDALDEIRRRIKLGLTCPCCTASKIPVVVEGKPGLLYDRQLSRIRKNFEPAKLLSFIKCLACAPLSSRDMLKSTIAGAQGDAIRLLASTEHKEFNNLNHSAQGSKDARTEEGKSLSVKVHVTQKQQAKASSVNVSPGLERVDSSKKKPRKLKTPDEGRPHLRSSVVHEVESTTKRRLENEKILPGEEGNAKEIASRSRERKKKEVDMPKSPSLSQEILPLVVRKEELARDYPQSQGERNVEKKISKSKELKKTAGDASKSTSLSQEIHPLDAYEEQQARDYSQSGQSLGQIESCEGSDSLKLAADNISAAIQRPDLLTNSENPHEVTGKLNSGADHGMEVPVVELLRKSSKMKRWVKKVKASKSEQGSTVKAKGTIEDDNIEDFDDDSFTKKRKPKIGSDSGMKAKGTREGDNTEGFDDSHTKKKKQKVASDSTMKAKGTMDDHKTEGFEDSHTKKKKQKMLAGTKHMDDQGDTEGFVTPDSVSRLIRQETETVSGKIIYEETGSKEPSVERVASSSSAEDAATYPELVMQKEEVMLDIQESNVAVVSALDVEQGVQSGSKPRVCSSETEGVMDVSEEEGGEENIKGTDTAIDVLKPEKVQVQSREDNMVSIVIEGGKANTESSPIGSTASEDAAYKGPNASSSKAEPGVCAGTMPSSSVTGILKDGMSRETKESFLGKHLKEDKKFQKPSKEAQLELAEESKSKESSKRKEPKKRVLDENEHLSKDSRAVTKKLKSSSADISCETLKSSEAMDVARLHTIGQGSAQLHDLQEGAVPVAPKPLEAVRSDIEQSGQCLEMAGFGDGGDYDSGYGSKAAREQVQVGEQISGDYLEPVPGKVEVARHDQKHDKIGAAAPKVVKKSVSLSNTLSSSVISLRPVFEAKSPLQGSRGVSNRFGTQRVALQAEEAKRFKNRPHEGTLEDSFKNRPQEERTLMIKFAKGFLMPSERQLRKVFCNFGDLNEPQTRIDSERRCAQVVFRQTQDAAAALSHMHESPYYENALFWLKSGESDVRELAKQSSKLSSTLPKPFLSNTTKQSSKLSPTLEKPFVSSTSTMAIKAASGTARLGSSERDRATDGRPDVPYSSHSWKEVDGAEADNIIYSQAKTFVNNPSLSTISHASEKALSMDMLASRAGTESIPTLSRNSHVCLKEATSRAGIESIPTSSRNPHTCLKEATSLSALSRLGQGMSDSQATIDISDQFTALLHQVQDIVESIGFAL